MSSLVLRLSRLKGRQNGIVKGDKTDPLTNINKTNKNNQGPITTKMDKDELRSLVLQFVHDPVAALPADLAADRHLTTRDSDFWWDWMFEIYGHIANPREALQRITSILERGWVATATPYPRLISNTPRALAYEARLAKWLSVGELGSFRVSSATGQEGPGFRYSAR